MTSGLPCVGADNATLDGTAEDAPVEGQQAADAGAGPSDHEMADPGDPSGSVPLPLENGSAHTAAAAADAAVVQPPAAVLPAADAAPSQQMVGNLAMSNGPDVEAAAGADSSLPQTGPMQSQPAVLSDQLPQAFEQAPEAGQQLPADATPAQMPDNSMSHDDRLPQASPWAQQAQQAAQPAQQAQHAMTSAQHAQAASQRAQREQLQALSNGRATKGVDSLMDEDRSALSHNCTPSLSSNAIIVKKALC